MAVWAAHETEQLIHLVRQNHTLYDPSSNDYRNRDVLKTLWNNIAEEMNRSDMDCRDRWNSLRDGYRRFVKDEQGPSIGSKPKKKKTWHWSEAMAFLKPYIQERTPTTAITALDANTSRNHIQKTLVITSNQVTNSAVTSNVEASGADNGDVSEEGPRDESGIHEPVSCSSSDSKWQPSISSSVEATSTSGVAPIVIAHAPAQPQDPDEQFFRSLLPDVKVLSPRQRGIFKIQVQQLLQEMLYPKECGGGMPNHPPEPAASVAQPAAHHIAYCGYGSLYGTSERWTTNVQGGCEYNKPHSS